MSGTSFHFKKDDNQIKCSFSYWLTVYTCVCAIAGVHLQQPSAEWKMLHFDDLCTHVIQRHVEGLVTALSCRVTSQSGRKMARTVLFVLTVYVPSLPTAPVFAPK